MLTSLPRRVELDAPPPESIIGYASVQSRSGTSVFEVVGPPGSAVPFHSTPDAFVELTGGEIVAVERLMHTEAGRQRYVTHFDIQGTNQPRELGLGASR